MPRGGTHWGCSAALLAVVALPASGCLWRSYEEIERVHVDVLVSMADKLADEADADVRPGPSDVTELLYPLQRARQFAHQYRSRSPRHSYGAFLTLLERYQTLVDRVDAARADPVRWEHLRGEIPALRGEVHAAAGEVRSALAEEGGGRRQSSSRRNGVGGVVA